MKTVEEIIKETDSYKTENLHLMTEENWLLIKDILLWYVKVKPFLDRIENKLNENYN
jgi:hypothetical protein